MHNVPFERFERDRGAFATWDVINVPRWSTNAPSGTLSRSPAATARRDAQLAPRLTPAP